MARRLFSVLAGGVILMSTSGFLMLSSSKPVPMTLTLTVLPQTGCQNGCQANQVPDNLGAHAPIATAAVQMSDGTQCSGPPVCTLTSSSAFFAISGLTVITAQALTSANDGPQMSNITVN